MHKVLVNGLVGLSLPRKSVVRLTDRPDMTIDVYRGRKTTIQYKKKFRKCFSLTTATKIRNNSKYTEHIFIICHNFLSIATSNVIYNITGYKEKKDNNIKSLVSNEISCVINTKI